MRTLAILVATLTAGCASQPATETLSADALAKLANQSKLTFSSTDVEQKTTVRVAQPF
jgi:hypothetical protein